MTVVVARLGCDAVLGEIPEPGDVVGQVAVRIDSGVDDCDVDAGAVERLAGRADGVAQQIHVNGRRSIPRPGPVEARTAAERRDLGVNRYREDGWIRLERRQIVAMQDDGQRVEIRVLRLDDVAVALERLLQRGGRARSRLNDDALCGRPHTRSLPQGAIELRAALTRRGDCSGAEQAQRQAQRDGKSLGRQSHSVPWQSKARAIMDGLD